MVIVNSAKGEEYLGLPAYLQVFTAVCSEHFIPAEQSPLGLKAGPACHIPKATPQSLENNVLNHVLSNGAKYISQNIENKQISGHTE